MNNFSLFEGGIYKTKPVKSINVLDFLELLKKENPLVNDIRACEDEIKREQLKKRLGYVTFAGVFSQRKKTKLIESSGFACFDLDNGKDLENLKDNLMKDKYIHLLFISPSGKGLKFLVKIPQVKDDLEYQEYWKSISNYYALPETDEANKDISRACYFSFDKEPYFNPQSEIYQDKIKVIQTTIAPSYQRQEKKSTGKSNQFLDKLKSQLSMEEVLRHFGVDTSRNPTNCPFHICSQRCLQINLETAHCFDTDCSGDNSWNIFSFVKKIKGYNSPEAIKFLSDLAGMQEEYEQARQEYFNSLHVPKGWACSISITRFAERHNFLNCFICNTPFIFDEIRGLYFCKSCKQGGGLKQFALLLATKLNQEVTP